MQLPGTSITLEHNRLGGPHPESLHMEREWPWRAQDRHKDRQRDRAGWTIGLRGGGGGGVVKLEQSAAGAEPVPGMPAGRDRTLHSSSGENAKG